MYIYALYGWNDLVEFYVSAKIVDRKHSQMLYIYNNASDFYNIN